MNDLPVPLWMLWTAMALCLATAAGIAVASWRARRYPAFVPSLTFQALPGSNLLAAAAPGSGRTAKPGSRRTFMPAPAPLAPALAEGQAEQRTDYRRVGNPVMVLVADADPQRRPWNAWVIDRSRRGLRLAVEEELKVGEVYTLRAAQAPPATPWNAIEVRHCAEVDGHWEIGCRFLQAPPVSLLMLFG